MTLEFHIGRDNTQSVKLSDNSTGKMAPSDIGSVTRTLLEIGEVTIDSDTGSYFTLDSLNSTVKIHIGAHPELVAGNFNAHLILFDPSYPNGIKWEPGFRVKVYD